MDDDRAVLAATTAKLLAAVNASDVGGVLSVWAADGVLMPPNHPSVKGQESLRTYFQDLFSKRKFRFAFSSSFIELVGDTALEHIAYTVTTWALDSELPIEDRGKGLHVYRRQHDGAWKLIRDIWNSDQRR